MLDELEERWLPVVGYDGYEVSDQGRVRSLDRVVIRDRAGGTRTQKCYGRVRKPQAVGVGYLGIVLYSGGSSHPLYVHRLVLEAFCRPPNPGEQGNHLDFDKTNNRLDNLEWTTPKENQAHAAAGGHTNRGERNGQARLDTAAVVDIRTRAVNGENKLDLMREYGVSRRTIFSICSRTIWKHI